MVINCQYQSVSVTFSSTGSWVCTVYWLSASVGLGARAGDAQGTLKSLVVAAWKSNDHHLHRGCWTDSNLGLQSGNFSYLCKSPSACKWRTRATHGCVFWRVVQESGQFTLLQGLQLSLCGHFTLVHWRLSCEDTRFVIWVLYVCWRLPCFRRCQGGAWSSAKVCVSLLQAGTTEVEWMGLQRLQICCQ